MKIYQCQTCEKIYIELSSNIDDSDDHIHTVEPHVSREEDLDHEHVLTFVQIGNFVRVIMEHHPMIEVHHIQWLGLKTNQGFYVKQCQIGELPVKEFILHDDEKIMAIYAYCNIHRLDQHII